MFGLLSGLAGPLVQRPNDLRLSRGAPPILTAAASAAAACQAACLRSGPFLNRTASETRNSSPDEQSDSWQEQPAERKPRDEAEEADDARANCDNHWSVAPRRPSRDSRTDCRHGNDSGDFAQRRMPPTSHDWELTQHRASNQASQHRQTRQGDRQAILSHESVPLPAQRCGFSRGGSQHFTGRRRLQADVRPFNGP
jgi:hypothetical protein